MRGGRNKYSEGAEGPVDIMAEYAGLREVAIAGVVRHSELGNTATKKRGRQGFEYNGTRIVADRSAIPPKLQIHKPATVARQS